MLSLLDRLIVRSGRLSQQASIDICQGCQVVCCSVGQGLQWRVGYKCQATRIWFVQFTICTEH